MVPDFYDDWRGVCEIPMRFGPIAQMFRQRRGILVDASQAPLYKRITFRNEKW